MFLLDTNVITQMRRPELAPMRFLRWLSEADASHFYLSTISLLELETGAVQAAKRNQSNAMILRDWIDRRVLPQFAGKFLDVTVEVVRRCAPFVDPDPKLLADALIAATALVHNQTVVTRNTRHFIPWGVRVLDPFAPS